MCGGGYARRVRRAGQAERDRSGGPVVKAPAASVHHADTRDAPLEFEKYVAQSLGYPLPLFGRSLFSTAPSTFAPLANVPVPADYVIGPGDELVIRGWGQAEIAARVSVDRSGQIFLPKVGMVSVAGVHYADLHAHLLGAIQRVLHDFELNVSLGQLRSIQILVVGQAQQPGSYTVSSLSTLVNALFTCGGPSVRGSMRRIELRRGDRTVTTLDLYELLLKGDKSHDVSLLPGDVIYIPSVGPLAALSGSVNVPGIYELAPGTSLEQGIALAGGIATTADNQSVSIERIEQHHVRRVTELALDGSERSFGLNDGDIVRMVAISPAIENAVTLRGNVAHLGRYPWRAGMKIHDLIPNREFLLTREYWDKKNKLVLGDNPNLRRPAEPMEKEKSTGNGDSDTKEKAANNDRKDSPFPSDSPQGVPRDQAQVLTEIRLNAPEINWDYAAVQRTNPVDLSAELLPFNLAKAIDSEAANDLGLRPGDIVTIFSERDLEVAIAKRTTMVRLEGEFLAPGVYRCLPGETLRQLVARIGLTSESYLYGAELSRESTRIQQQQGFDRMLSEMEKISCRSVPSGKMPTTARARRTTRIRVTACWSVYVRFVLPPGA